MAPLHWAAARGSVKCARMLIDDFKADINSTSTVC